MKLKIKYQIDKSVYPVKQGATYNQMVKQITSKANFFPYQIKYSNLNITSLEQIQEIADKEQKNSVKLMIVRKPDQGIQTAQKSIKIDQIQKQVIRQPKIERDIDILGQEKLKCQVNIQKEKQSQSSENGDPMPEQNKEILVNFISEQQLKQAIILTESSSSQQNHFIQLNEESLNQKLIQSSHQQSIKSLENVVDSNIVCWKCDGNGIIPKIKGFSVCDICNGMKQLSENDPLIKFLYGHFKHKIKSQLMKEIKESLRKQILAEVEAKLKISFGK